MVLIRLMLVTEDAALVPHSKATLQELISHFSHECTHSDLTIIYIIGQDIRNTPSISTDDQILQVVGEFTYLSSTVSKHLYLEAEQTHQQGNISNSSPLPLDYGPVYSALYCMAMRHGHPMPNRSIS